MGLGVGGLGLAIYSPEQTHFATEITEAAEKSLHLCDLCDLYGNSKSKIQNQNEDVFVKLSLHRRALSRYACVIAIALLFLISALPAAAQNDDPVLAAQQIQRQLFDAQRQLANDPTGAHAAIEAIRAQHTAQFAAQLPAEADDAAQAAEQALIDAQTAAKNGDAIALTQARADYRTALAWAGYTATLTSVQSGDAESAARWLKLREFKKSSRLNPPTASATRAVQMLAQGGLAPEQAATTIAADLDETYQTLMNGALQATIEATERQFQLRAAEEAALASGYFRILRSGFAERQGEASAAAVEQAFAALRTATAAGQRAEVNTAPEQIKLAIGDYRAVQLSLEETKQRAGRLQQFLDLVPYEYGKGVRNGQIAIPFEIEEARTFLGQSAILAAELRPSFSAEQAQRLDAAIIGLEQGITDVVEPAQIKALAADAQAVVVEVFGEIETGGATFELIDTLLNQYTNALRRGDYQAAEQTRIEAYALFEIGPEPRLLGRDPVLATRIESLFWQGDGQQVGLATAAAQKLSFDTVQPSLTLLQSELDKAESLLTAGMSLPVSIISSMAIILREGLEAVLVLGAALAVLRRAQAGKREGQALFGGAALALGLSLVTWVLAQTLLDIGVAQRELLEAIMGLLAVVVLVLVTNWLVHKAYVVDWVSYVRAQIDQARQNGGRAALGALALLGFTVVYREGFETVLFYQALLFDASPQGVLIGFIIGSIACLALAYAILKLSLRLPLKPFFNVTGALLIILALALIGSSARNLQEASVLPVTPLTFIPAHPLAATFGIYPTVETVAAQLALALFLAATFALVLWRGRMARMATAGGV
jgi:high-affinity iron transporter